MKWFEICSSFAREGILNEYLVLCAVHIQYEETVFGVALHNIYVVLTRLVRIWENDISGNFGITFVTRSVKLKKYENIKLKVNFKTAC